MPILWGSVNVRACDSREWYVCALTSDRQSSPKRRKGLSCLQLCSMSALHMGAVESSALSMAICAASCVHVVCVAVCEWLCDTCSALLLVEFAIGKVAAVSLGHGWKPLGSSSQEEEFSIPRAAGGGHHLLHSKQTAVKQL